MMIQGRIHSIETMGTLDGPGIRTVFFLQGCNMQCVYCHNRDSWSLNGGELYTVGKVVSTALSYREYYGEDGGVTFSGGEPLLQGDFLFEAAASLKKYGISTAVDTSGSVFNRKVAELFRLVDLVILDIKHSDMNQYGRICSFSGDSAFCCLEYLQNSNIRYRVRQVIVEGYTDTVEQVDHLAEILESDNPPERVELLPYHDMGKNKWANCGKEYPLDGVLPPTEERVGLLRGRLKGLR